MPVINYRNIPHARLLSGLVSFSNVLYMFMLGVNRFEYIYDHHNSWPYSCVSNFRNSAAWIGKSAPMNGQEFIKHSGACKLTHYR